MRIRHFAARAIQKALARFGFTMVRIGASHITMESAINSIAGRKHQFRTVVDVGASDGNWSELMMRHFPSCSYLLIEAQPVHDRKLRDFCSRHGNAKYSLVAAGETHGQINFDSTDPFGGLASPEPFAVNNIVVPVAPLDEEVQKSGFPGPYLLKFDTHGFEIPILKGAHEILQDTEAIIMECYNFRISSECLLFHEMCEYIGKLGFRCIDLVSPMHRPLDDAFWQMDLVFVRETRPEFRDLRFRQDP
jgi:FkbM family methyltransferase